jgi:Domain of unknown function (DUF4114)
MNPSLLSHPFMFYPRRLNLWTGHAIAVSTIWATAIGLTWGAPAQAVQFGTSWDSHCVGGTGAQSCSLQNLIDHITVSGPQVNTQSDSGIELFRNQASPSTSHLLFSIAGSAAQNTFGIYKSTDPSTKVQLLNGSTGAGQLAMVSFLSNGTVKVGETQVQNFGQEFGFYLEGPGGTYYTQAGLNGGRQQAVTYQGNGQTQFKIAGQKTLFSSDQFLIGFEDLPLAGSDQDYNDLFVLVGGLRDSKAVAEPGLILSLGGLSLVLAVKKRRSTT